MKREDGTTNEKRSGDTAISDSPTDVHDRRLQRNAFALAVSGTDTLKGSDFPGIASSSKMAENFERTGLHEVR